jgi:hypothetical protein
MGERLYHLRQGQVVFETGTAQGKQILLATIVQDILLHWFAPDGAFLGLERHRMAVAPDTYPATTIYRTGAGYWGLVEREVAALKEKVGFIPGDIAVAKFESEEASIQDLPGEYEEFLHDPEVYSPEDREAFEGYIRRWRQSGSFVLEFSEQYWMSAAGEVEAS